MRAIRPAFVALLLSAVLLSTATAAGESQRKMLAEAKVDRTHAEVIALGRARDGKVKSSAIQRQRGRLVWKFEIETADGNGSRQVIIDAKTGKVVSVRQSH